MIASSENQALAIAMGGGGSGNIWSQTRGQAYNQLTPGRPAFLTDAQKCRLDRIAQARMLFDGLHREYYLAGGRTAFDFPYVKSNGINQRMYLTHNVLGLISVKSADLLFGQSPLLDCDDEGQWESLHDLTRRTQIHAVLLDASIAGSAEGEVFLEAMIHTDGQVYVRQLDCLQIFPIGEVQPDGQYASYMRCDLKNIGSDESPTWILLETTIGIGQISRACWQLGDRYEKLRQIDVKNFDPSLTPAAATGIDQCTIVWIPNLRGRALSDYDCALELQDALNAKNTQVARVLQKHSDPKLAAPRKMADPQGNIPAAAETYYFDDPTAIPKYITWDPQLAFAIQDRAFVLNQLLVRTETSPVLLGMKEGSAPDAYKKVRLEAFNSITKAARKAIAWTAGVQRILEVAMLLDNTRPGVGYPVEPVGVTLRDGIPSDDSEIATNIATLRAAGVLSRRRAVQMQLGDEAAVDAEVAELDREAAAATPSVFVGTTAGAGGAPEAPPATSLPAPTKVDGGPMDDAAEDAQAGEDTD